MNPNGLLLAAGEWIGIVIFVIFVAFSILSQLAGKWKEVQKEVARRARANGLAVLPLSAYFVGPARLAGLVLGFAGTPTAMAADAARRLRSAIG